MKKRKLFYIIIPIIIILMIILYFYFNKEQTDPYSFKGNRIYYSENRGIPRYNLIFREEDDNLTVYNITFESKKFMDDTTIIHGLLFIPKNKQNVPGVLIVPGGGVKKEQRIDISKTVANQGYVVLTIDQRGIGETAGIYLSIEDDYNVFINGHEPIQHLSVYDLLRSYDLLKEIREVDENNIAFLGESMGGRYAIIASAIDKRIKGVIVVSSSGFDIKFNPNDPSSIYLMSIDPDNYIGRISPNPIYFIQIENDTTVTTESAKKTFNKANEPKEIKIINECVHGFCDYMNEDIIGYLREIFNG